jgi:hypothetical protein
MVPNGDDKQHQLQGQLRELRYRSFSRVIKTYQCIVSGIQRGPETWDDTWHQRRTDTIAKGYQEWVMVMPRIRYSKQDDPLIQKEKHGCLFKYGQGSFYSESTKLSTGEPLNVKEEIAYAAGKYELSKVQQKDMGIRDYYVNIQESSMVRTDEEKQHHRTIVDCMKGDMERSLRMRCEQLLNCWKCGSVLLDEDVECTFWTDNNKQHGNFGGMLWDLWMPFANSIGRNSKGNAQKCSTERG